MAVVRSIRFDRNAPVDPSAPTTTHNWYEDPSGVLASGFWSSKPYKAGDAFLIPKGFKGAWETVEAVKKFYVIHTPKGGA